MHGTLLASLVSLKKQFDALRKGKGALLAIIAEAELPESVYNSNAIENSTLTLDETEKLLLHQALPTHHSRREIFEATNLAAAMEFLGEKAEKKTPLTEEIILLVHGTLLHSINDNFAGRFRISGEYVRVGCHIAPPPERIPFLISEALSRGSDESVHPLEHIARFHAEFERIHPFCDGNGRVGRAIMNFELAFHGYPPIIVQNKEKQEYYRSLVAYEEQGDAAPIERILGRLLKESFHKRLAYLTGDEIAPISVFAKTSKRSPQSIANAAKKQSLSAFREREIWKTGKRAFQQWEKRT